MKKHIAWGLIAVEYNKKYKNGQLKHVNIF